MNNTRNSPLQEALSRFSNVDLDTFETRIRRARSVTTARRDALDALLKEIRRDRMWRERGS